MDRNQRTSDLIKEFNRYKKSPDRRGSFVKVVCEYYDSIKTEELTESDLNFLRYMANEAGVPQYFDLLNKKYQSENYIAPASMNLLSVSSFLNEANLTVNNQMLHKYQKEILDQFSSLIRNRYVLSAPTSFGKTFLMYEIIKKIKYSNILLIFPTISLLSENYMKLISDKFFESYKIHTLSEIKSEELGEKNIFIYTPERYLSFLDNNDRSFEFTFIDEIYKIDNDFIIDTDTPEENERDTAYRLALEYACRDSNDMLLVGPYIQFPSDMRETNSSFQNFVSINDFNIIEYNDVEIVSKTLAHLDRNKFEIENTVYRLKSGTKSMQEKVVQSVLQLIFNEGNIIIYCSSKYDTERFAKKLLDEEAYNTKLEQNQSSTRIFNIFLEHIERTFGADWIVFRALSKRIGIHNSGIPKYIQKEIINLFNQGELFCLFSTTTITEGVNTTAKNLIVTSVRKGIKPLKQFDAKNIAGRAGRFNSHYSGNVIDLTKDFVTIIDSEQDSIEHRNYDENRNKTDIDLEVTRDNFLTDSDKILKENIEQLKKESELPSFIFQSYKVISPFKKISMYNRIRNMSSAELRRIDQLKQALQYNRGTDIHWDGFQTVVNICKDFVDNSFLKGLMEREIEIRGKNSVSLLVIQLSNYLKNGFLGTVQYYVNQQNKPKDTAMRETANLVYTTFKYHLVKHLGVFDLLYRYYISQIDNRKFDDVPGIQILLQRLEYNALTAEGRKLSDYGVPFALVKYYDEKNNQKQFDEYEMHIDIQVQNLLK